MRQLIDLNDYEIKKFFINGKEMGRGRSGQLLLATGKEYYVDGKPRRDRWILKHNFPHLAASEYLYHRIAGELGIGSPTVVLIDYHMLNEKTRQYFSTPYIVAIEYIEPIVRGPSMDDIHNADCGFYYYGHKMLQYIFRDRDSFDIMIGKSVRRAYPEVYRLDVSESFWLPTGLDKDDFYLRMNTIKYLHSEMTKATNEWNESCINNIMRYYWNQIEQVKIEKEAGKGLHYTHSHGYGVYYYRTEVNMLEKLSIDFFWNLCNDLGEVYNYYIQEMFMLYFLRLNRWLPTLYRRFEEGDPGGRIVIKAMC